MSYYQKKTIFPVEFCLGNVGTILKQTVIEPVNSLMLSTGIYYCDVHLVTLVIYGISGMRSSCPFLKSVYMYIHCKNKGVMVTPILGVKWLCENDTTFRVSNGVSAWSVS